MTGLSIESTLGLWASSRRDVKTRIRPLFTQDRVAASAGRFLDGLLDNEQRKMGWMGAEVAGDRGPCASRRSSAVVTGMAMRFVTSSAITR
jgi:hypothetical protein